MSRLEDLRARIEAREARIGVIGLVADVLSGTRKMLEDLLYRVRRMELDRRGARADEPAER